MTTVTTTVNGRRATRIVIRVPYCGPWSAIVDFDEAIEGALSGAASVQIGGQVFSGTFIPGLTSTFQLQSRGFIIGGAGGWRTVLPAKHYHSDSGVHARSVIAELASATGETLAGAAYDSILGVDWVRQEQSAARSLRDALRGTAWWVGQDGGTRIGARADVEVTEPYEVLDVDPRWKVATVSADSAAAVGVGSTLRARLVRPLRVREVEVQVTGGRMRLACWGQEVTS